MNTQNEEGLIESPSIQEAILASLLAAKKVSVQTTKNGSFDFYFQVQHGTVVHFQTEDATIRLSFHTRKDDEYVSTSEHREGPKFFGTNLELPYNFSEAERTFTFTINGVEVNAQLS